MMPPIGVIGWQEGLIFAVAVVVLFGARKIPELARGLGEGITEFKKAIKKPAAKAEDDSEEPESKESDG